jgi:hypothetical protein
MRSPGPHHMTQLQTGPSSATRAVSWGHQASDTKHGGRSRIGTKVTPGRLYQVPTASDVILMPTPREMRWVSASRVLASATTRRRPGPVVGEYPVVPPWAWGDGRGNDRFRQHVHDAERIPASCAKRS